MGYPVYGGSVMAGLALLSKSVRNPGRVLVWAWLTVVCSAPCALAAGIQDPKMVPPAYGAERLPAAPIAEAQEASLWTRYRWYVIGAGVLILVEAFLIAGLLLERTGRRRAELSLAERLRFESLLSELSARLIPVSLDRRGWRDRAGASAGRRSSCVSIGPVSTSTYPAGRAFASPGP